MVEPVDMQDVSLNQMGSMSRIPTLKIRHLDLLLMQDSSKCMVQISFLYRRIQFFLHSCTHSSGVKIPQKIHPIAFLMYLSKNCPSSESRNCRAYLPMAETFPRFRWAKQTLIQRVIRSDTIPSFKHANTEGVWSDNLFSRLFRNPALSMVYSSGKTAIHKTEMDMLRIQVGHFVLVVWDSEFPRKNAPPPLHCQLLSTISYC